MVRRMLVILVASAAAVSFFGAISVHIAQAHSGGTDSRGCHTCRTNCPRYGLYFGQYHCHSAGGNSSGSGGGRSGTNSRIAFCIWPGAGLTSADIRLIQSRLSRAGFRPGPIDGIYGARTRSALNSFERRRGLSLSPRSSIYTESIRQLSALC